MKKMWKIGSLVTLTLAITLSAIVIVFLFFIALWQTNLQRQELDSRIGQLADTITYSISEELGKMNQTSLSMLYSNTIRDNFNIYNQFITKSSSGYTVLEIYESSKLMNDLVHTIMTGKGNFSQVVLYQPKVGEYRFGAKTGYSNSSVIDRFWYKDVLFKDGRFLTLPYIDEELSALTTYNTDRHYLSMIRPLYSEYNTIDGYVEVVQNYDVIFEILDAITYDNDHKIIILNDQYQVLYPLSDVGDIVYQSEIEGIKESNDLLEFDNGAANEISFYKSFDNETLHCIIIVDKYNYYEPIRNFLLLFSIISIFLIGLSLVLSMFISRGISKPIYNFYTLIKTIDIMDQDYFNNNLPSTYLLEINALWLSIINYHEKLHDSFNQIMAIEKRELQAEMIALQAQMNPHFLYNSLSVLCSLIEDGQTEDAIKFSENLSTMLRYSSSAENPLVSFEDELEHTHTYLQCMQLRYDKDLTYSIHIPDELLEVKVPKLVIQSLVENAIKYSTLKQGPWHIDIVVRSTEDHWYVSVADNGIGFTQISIDQLYSSLTDIIKNNQLPHLSIEGMGILNLLYRIHLHSGSKPYLEIHNNEPCGSTVTIGGSYFD